MGCGSVVDASADGRSWRRSPVRVPEGLLVTKKATVVFGACGLKYGWVIASRPGPEARADCCYRPPRARTASKTTPSGGFTRRRLSSSAADCGDGSREPVVLVWFAGGDDRGIEVAGESPVGDPTNPACRIRAGAGTGSANGSAAAELV